ncbi:hypothetical protein HID58_009367 [Brassica napus]|uniref:Large ribosomal subunit protein uL24 C-terminal domain-containing protein n=1 Tax=Brassica napus TaxID=3708 RepID=A0ABQ8DSA3_BRANA|nr:hypothetical protein HID58_009367 [Brassica napus]
METEKIQTHKGKTGEVTKIFTHNSTIVIKDVSLTTKHMKSREEGEPGQILKIEALIHSSNAMLYSKEKEVRRYTITHNTPVPYDSWFSGAEPPEDWSSTPPPPPPPLNASPPNNIAPASNGAVKMDFSPLPDAAKNGYFLLTSLVRSMDQ